MENVCKRNKYGLSKFGSHCQFIHEDSRCRNQNCSEKDCRLRHPKICRYFSRQNYCKFGEYCKYSHEEVQEKSNPLEEKVILLENSFKKKDDEIANLYERVKKLEKLIEEYSRKSSCENSKRKT